MVGVVLPPSPRMQTTFWIGVSVAVFWRFGTGWFKNAARR
jgi:hypothetical protein